MSAGTSPSLEGRPENVRPFSSGSEALSWRWRNCERCAKCGTPDAEGVGPCTIETFVSMGFIVGTIPTEIATLAGAEISDQLDAKGNGFCDMPRECKELDLVMTCEAIADRRKRAKPKCGATATAIVTEKGYRHAVCEKHRRIVERDNRSRVPDDGGQEGAGHA